MATKAATHYLQFDIQWSSIALLFYDYALTFPLEVKYIWGSKVRLSTTLYIFCRYALVANVLYLLAIANRLKQRSALLLPASNLLLSILMVVFEYSSAILTITRSLMAFKVGRRKGRSKGLINIIFEQGVLYFSIISLFTTTAVILNVEAPAGFFQRLLNAYTLPLSGLLTARFLLHIRAYEDKEHSRALAAQTRTGTLHFDTLTTLASFRAAAGGAISSMVDQFGGDPVEAAQRQMQAESDTTAAAENSYQRTSEWSLVRSESESTPNPSGSSLVV
ncbi:hypothetical protein EYR36_011646 [Pleurotus pulmonarius]|nr:hypothetical protein EYR36_011646 [Pleurotus pulmonarius]KAF4607451.1 hypothetical protein EYR38_001522 [Pleurotus pulmonarius]